MKLAELQSAFQAALLDGSDGIMASIPDSPRESKDVLFGVYRYAYKARLIGILHEDFERVHTYIGDAAFEALARGYVAAHPSHTPNARYYGQSFPEFVAACKTFAGAPIVAAIARLEGALNDVFDCADAPALTLEDLAAFAPEDFANIEFTPHPSARRFDVPVDLDAVWSALAGGSAPPAVVDLEAPQHFVVWRQDTKPYYRVMLPEAAMLWDEAAKGVRFAILCEMAATYDDPGTAPARVAQYLHSWISDGMIAHAKAD